jgi:HD-like signal output (HDOD) protein
MDTTIPLEQLTEAANRLEGLPTSLTRLTSLVASNDFRLDEVVEVISYDPVLTAGLLRAANSASSGASREISTVQEAVVRLGASTVSSLAMGATVGGRFRRSQAAPGLWVHSVTATIACDIVNFRSKVWVPAAAATAALLHDVGKLVLAEALTPNILRRLELVATSENLTADEAERAVLMVDHGELGAIAAQAWELPDVIVGGIANHHRIERAESPLDWAVMLADAIAHSVTEDLEEARVPAAQAALEWLELTEADYLDMVLATKERWDKVAEHYGGQASNSLGTGVATPPQLGPPA